MIRTIIGLAAVALLGACRQSAPERVRDAEQRAAANASVARSEVVRSLASPRTPGRIIYDKPMDLSYENLRKTRPDLDSARLVHRTPAATEKSRRDTSKQ
jgi:hypothetical protein